MVSWNKWNFKNNSMTLQNKMLNALMDEYRRASIDYKAILKGLSIAHFQQIRDTQTPDPDCRSVQSIAFHVVQSGYTYANYINTASSNIWQEYKQAIDTPETAIAETDKMLDYTAAALLPLAEQSDQALAQWQFKARWGVQYDLEQLLEHAIVHILRHRRQIENFIKNDLT